MNNDDERDYAEEAVNQALLDEHDEELEDGRQERADDYWWDQRAADCTEGT